VPPHTPTTPDHHEYTHNTSNTHPLPLEASTSLTNPDPQPPSPPKLPLSPSAIALNDIPDDDLDILTRHHAARLAQLFYKESNAVVVADHITRVSHSHRDINPIVGHLLRAAQHLPTAIVTPARLPDNHDIDSSATISESNGSNGRNGCALGAAGAEEVCRYGWDDIALLLPHECRVTFFDAAADVMSRDGEREEADVGADRGEGGVGVGQSIGGEDVSRLLPVLYSEDSLYSLSVYRDVPLPSVLIRARTGLYLSGLCAVEKVLLDVLIYLVWVYRATGLEAFMELYDEVLACPRDAMENGTGKDNQELPAGNSQMMEFGFPHQENTFDNLQLLVDIYFTSLEQAKTPTHSVSLTQTDTKTVANPGTHTRHTRSPVKPAEKPNHVFPENTIPDRDLMSGVAAQERIGDATLYTFKMNEFLSEGEDDSDKMSKNKLADSAIVPEGKQQKVVTIVDESIHIDVTKYSVASSEIEPGAGSGFEEPVWVDLFDLVFPHVPNDIQLMWDANAVAVAVRRMSAGDGLWWRLRLRADVWAKRGKMNKEHSPLSDGTPSGSSTPSASLLGTSPLGASPSGVSPSGVSPFSNEKSSSGNVAPPTADATVTAGPGDVKAVQVTALTLSPRPTVVVREDTVHIDTPDARIVLPPRKFGLKPSLFKRVPEHVCEDLLEADDNLADLYRYFVPNLLPAVLFWAEYMASAAEVLIETVNKGHY